MSNSSDLVFARELVRASATASLATLDPNDGPPHASLVTVALSQNVAPVMLLSDLALHRKNIAADPSVALLMTGEGRVATARGDPLASDRVTLRGTVTESSDSTDRIRFLARHPAAKDYADFTDFNFFRMQVTSVHLVGGFGRIRTYSGEKWPPDAEAMAALTAGEADIVQHMNIDHADALTAYATSLLHRPPGAWRMTGIDPWGVDLRLDDQIARLSFEEPVATPDAARKTLMALVRQARIVKTAVE
ncbi:MAG: DUF2470 domain-containing protein [Rhodospirillaceae bacterium]|nr:DUF2470 domain-containing protein [Rhodospirillaceae bacterium]